MADKTVNLSNTLINASTISDFYTRLNALRHLNGGTSTVSFTAPSTGGSISATTLNETYNAVLSTKSALSFLAGVNISTYQPTVPNSGDLVEVKKTAHPIEWQIGQLENACFTNFTTNRVGNFTFNFINFGTAGTAVYNAFHTSQNATVHSNNFVSQNSANYGSDRVSVKSNHTTTCNANFNANKSNYDPGCAPFNSAQVVAHSTQNISNFTNVYTLFFDVNFSEQYFCSTNHFTHRLSQFSTVHGEFGGATCSPDVTFWYTTVHNSDHLTFYLANCVQVVA